MKRCSRCGADHDRNGRYCRDCHNAYMRAWRKKNPDKYDFKVRARKRVNMRQKRGLLKPAPCFLCSDPVAEKHHPDYTKPLLVSWLCVPCHKVMDRSAT